MCLIEKLLRNFFIGGLFLVVLLAILENVK